MDVGVIFKDLVWDGLVKSATAKLFTAIPFLGWGPIGIVMKLIIAKYADKLYEELHDAADMQAIFIKNEIHRKAYTKAVLTLRTLAIEKGINSPEFLEAREHEKKKFSEFVRFGVAR